MKKTTFSLIALLWVAGLILSWCNKSEPTENNENLGMANPASVYCEENWWTIKIVSDDEWNQSWLCMFDDGSYCDEWSYYRQEWCEKGMIMYNTLDEEDITNTIEEGIINTEEKPSSMYNEEEIVAGIETILNYMNTEWKVPVELNDILYLWDGKAKSELDYCKELASNKEWVETVDQCAVFTSSFHIPETDVEMAGAFEPNTDITDWLWYLGRTNKGEWKVLTFGN